MTPGGIRYLAAADVAACLPPLPRLLDLASLALRALIVGADVPPKAGVGEGSAVFAHAMPARLEAGAVPGGDAGVSDLLGMKWIAGGPGNRALGLPALASVIVLADPATGSPVAIIDGAEVTAWRTAALSGVAVRLLGPERAAGSDGTWRAVLLGAGVQGRAHAAMLGAVLPGVRLSIHDRHPERAAALAGHAAVLPGVAAAIAVAEPQAALRAADVVVSATALGGVPDLRAEDMAPGALVVPVDYGARVTPELVRSATTFLVDDLEQFARNVRSGRLAGWPEPSATLGDVLLSPRPRAPGLAVALHQGPAIADLVVAAAVVEAALAQGVGTILPR